MDDTKANGDRMRLDVWLWRTRLFKTRGAASEAIEAQGVRIERDGHVRRVDKPSGSVSIGDVLSFNSAAGVSVVRVLALPARRGPYAEASACYEGLEPAVRG